MIVVSLVILCGVQSQADGSLSLGPGERDGNGIVIKSSRKGGLSTGNLPIEPGRGRLIIIIHAVSLGWVVEINDPRRGVAPPQFYGDVVLRERIDCHRESQDFIVGSNAGPGSRSGDFAVGQTKRRFPRAEVW